MNVLSLLSGFLAAQIKSYLFFSLSWVNILFLLVRISGDSLAATKRHIYTYQSSSILLHVCEDHEAICISLHKF